jgi:(2Fe-2S) ferredoxin
MIYEKHVFICTNDKDAPKKCCGSGHGMELVNAMKEALASAGTDKKIRIQRAGCLDVCGKGPAMVVYPEGVFYGNVQKEDLSEIVEKHLLNDEIVNRLQIG